MMKLNFKSKPRKPCRPLFRNRYPLRLLATVIPLIPRRASYLEDLFGDG